MSERTRAPAPALTAAQRAIVEQEFPRFSDAEIAARRRLISDWMDEHELDHILVYGFFWAGNAIVYFTGWPVTSEAAVVFSRDARPAMYVQFYNHIPQATRIAFDADVAGGGESTIANVIETMQRRGGGAPRVGVVGPLTIGPCRALEAYQPVD